MPLTPADIHNMAFKKPALGSTGYGEEDVDAFLDEVERELARLLEENGALKERVQRGGTAERDELVDQLQRLEAARDRAAQQARDLQAELERARRPEPAAPTGDDRELKVLMMAQRTADEYVRDAQREAELVIGEARERAGQVVGDARAKAAGIENEARRNHTEAMEGLAGQRAALLEEIEQLGRLAATYRDALGRHVRQQLQDVESTPEVGQ